MTHPRCLRDGAFLEILRKRHREAQTEKSRATLVVKRSRRFRKSHRKQER